MRQFSPDVKELHANLRANPLFHKMIAEIKAQVSPMPEWSPEKPVHEPETAYYSGRVRGEEFIISILEGQFYE